MTTSRDEFLEGIRRHGGPAFPVRGRKVPDGGTLDQFGMTLRDWFAGQAMGPVMLEAQEMVPASMWDWFKSIAFGYGATFLHAEFRVVEGVYEASAKRALQYADAMLKEREK